MYDVYTTPKSYANIETLNEMDESGIKIHVVHHGLIVDVFGDEPPGSDLGNLRQKLVPVPMQDALMEKIAEYGDAAALERALSMVKIAHQYVRNDGSSYLHTVKECPRCVGGFVFITKVFLPSSIIILWTAFQVVRSCIFAGSPVHLHGALQSLRGFVRSIRTDEQMDR